MQKDVLDIAREDYDPNSHSPKNFIGAYGPLFNGDSPTTDDIKVEEYTVNPNRKIDRIVWIEKFGERMWLPEVEYKLYQPILEKCTFFLRELVDEGFKLRIKYAVD